MNFFKTFLASLLGSIIAFFASAILLFMLIFVIATSININQNTPFTNIPENSILSLKLDIPIMDNISEAQRFQENFGIDPEGVKLIDIVTAIDLAKSNDKIKGIHLRSDYIIAGWAQTKALRDALLSFKRSGKFIISYGDFFTQKGYYLASVADSIYINPLGSFEFKGLSSEVLYFKEFEDKYGFKMEVIRHGKYKSAVEPYLSKTMSDNNRQQIQELLNSFWQTISSEIADTRQISVSELDAIANGLQADLSEKAVSKGLLDGISYKNDYLGLLKFKVGLDEEDDLSLVHYNDLLSINRTYKKGVKDQIALIYAQGPILFGEGSEVQIGEEVFVDAIKNATKNKQIKAIVLRVDSPGGSALISDILWKTLEDAKKEKPLVVSMGNVAASGGYYIVCGADKIFASPMTITGSIGAYATVPNVKQFVDDIGINAEYVTTHDYAMGYSPFEPISEGFRKSIVQGIEQVYNVFKQKVAQGRNLSLEQVENVAQGRIWTGVQAKENGLIDELGGLNEAIKEAAKLAKIETYNLKSYPDIEPDFEDIFTFLTPFYSMKAKINEALPKQLMVFLEELKVEKSKAPKVQMQIPFSLDIK